MTLFKRNVHIYVRTVHITITLLDLLTYLRVCFILQYKSIKRQYNYFGILKICLSTSPLPTFLVSEKAKLFQFEIISFNLI
jgi:hypothetical protein